MQHIVAKLCRLTCPAWSASRIYQNTSAVATKTSPATSCELRRAKNVSEGNLSSTLESKIGPTITPIQEVLIINSSSLLFLWSVRDLVKRITESICSSSSRYYSLRISIIPLSSYVSNIRRNWEP